MAPEPCIRQSHEQRSESSTQRRTRNRHESRARVRTRIIRQSLNIRRGLPMMEMDVRLWSGAGPLTRQAAIRKRNTGHERADSDPRGRVRGRLVRLDASG